VGRTIKLEPQPANRCFGCGAGNEVGMKLTFDLDLDDRRTRGRFSIGPNFAGGGGFLHGGLIAVVLDEAMGKLSKLTEERAVTAEMTIVYRKPIALNQEILVEGWQTEEKGRNRFRNAEIHDLQGNLLASATGRFVVVAAEHFAKAIADADRPSPA
jgi:acyl-coenzyme A thioesterase PaaI-like protein